MSTNAATFAIIKICLKITIFALLDASFRTENIADAAFDAFGIIPDWPLRPPASRMIFTGAARA
jgi:predicted secreted protein